MPAQVKEWTTRFESMRSERIKLAWLDLSLPDSALTAQALAERFECSPQHVANVMSAHQLPAARMEKIRQEAEAKARQLSVSMQDTLGDAVNLQAVSIRSLKAISDEVEELLRDKSKANEENLLRLRNLELAAKILKVGSNSATAVQTHALRVSELSKLNQPTLPVPSPETPVNGQALELDALGFDNDASLFDELEY